LRQVVEHSPGGNTAIRYTVNRSAIDGPSVIEYSFRLEMDSGVHAP
jgi:hypothetical protein